MGRPRISILFRAVLLLFMLMLHANQPAAALERSTPEALGISSRAILGFVDAAEGSIDALHSFMLLRGGKVVAEGWWYPYNPDSPHRLYSLSKSFTSTAVGLAVEEGLLSLDDLVLDHFHQRPFSTGRRQRRMERGQHLQSEALLLRDALSLPADFPLRRRPAALRHGVQCRLWGDEVGRADCEGADGRGS